VFVYFDIGSVLIDLDWDSFIESLSSLASPGLDVLAALRTEAALEHLHAWSTGNLGPAAFARALLSVVRPGHSRVSPHDATALLAIKEASSLIVGPVRPRCLRLVKRLRALGCGVGVLSNAVPWHETDIETTLRLRDVFDVVVFSQDVGFEKPEPGIYEAAELLAKATRRVQHPVQFFFVDDLPANVLAARERGWNASLVELVEAGVRQRFLEGSMNESEWLKASRNASHLVFGEEAAKRVEALFTNVFSALEGISALERNQHP
jgi:HAD superfamily hydrolase (TIGR01509 family)